MLDPVRIPLYLPTLPLAGWNLQRSGMRWLCDDGAWCRPGEVIAYCNLGLLPQPGQRVPGVPFANETRDLQVALAPRVGGRLVKAAGVARGGFMDLLGSYHAWSPDTCLGHLECAPDEIAGNPATAGRLRPLFVTGRRVTELAEVRSGLLSGWYQRSRAWWAEGDMLPGTVLGLGICHLAGVLRGEQGAFLELFERAPGPAHVVFVPDDVLVPCAPILSAQLRATAAERTSIVEDLARHFGAAFVGMAQTGTPLGALEAGDWIFAGCLLHSLLSCPLLERFDVLTFSTVQQVGPADAIILTLSSEGNYYLRHKRLGYAVSCHDFRLADTGPALRHWLRTEFEVVRRSVADIERDYRELLGLLRAGTDPHVLIVNQVSSTRQIDVCCYAPFEKPLGETLPHIRSRELNLMLCDLAREWDVAIVDLDALAAEFGTGQHIPDAIHPSGPLQDAMRSRILETLGARGVRGFG